MELTISQIKKLMELMVDNKIDSLSFNGLILQKSSHSSVKEPEVKVVETVEEDKEVSINIMDHVPQWIKDNQDIMFAPPFPEVSTKDNE